MPPFYHKRRRLPANTGELECIWPKMQCEIFFTLIFHTVKKTFIIFRNALVIFCNAFHCRYKEFIIFIIVYFLLHCPLYSVFLCVCNVNFEEKLLYFMMLNSSLVPLLRLFRLYKTSIILKSITVAVIKVCSETSFSKKSYHIETGQLICRAINWLVSIWYERCCKIGKNWLLPAEMYCWTITNRYNKITGYRQKIKIIYKVRSNI